MPISIDPNSLGRLKQEEEPEEDKQKKQRTGKLSISSDSLSSLNRDSKEDEGSAMIAALQGIKNAVMAPFSDEEAEMDIDEAMMRRTQEAIPTIKENKAFRPDAGGSPLAAAEHTIEQSGKGLVGTGEVGLEFLSGLASVSLGTVAATGSILPGIREDNFALREKLGRVPTASEAWMATYGAITDALTIQPKTEMGKEFRDGIVESIFEPFRDWGETAGDFVFEKTDSPALATAVRTAIEGFPFYAPLIAGKGKVEHKRRIKDARRKVEELEDLYKQEVENIEIAGPVYGRFDPITSTKMKPSEILEHATQTQLRRSPAEMVDLAKSMQEKGMLEPIILERTPQGGLALKEGHHRASIAKEIWNDKKVDVKIIERAPVDRASPEFQADVRKSQEMLDKNREAFAKEEKITVKGLLEGFRTRFTDASAGMRDRLIRTEAGKQAMAYHDLAAGGTTRGQLRYQAYEDVVYKGLDRNTIHTLDDMIFMTRVMEIDRVHGVGKVQHPGGINGVKASRWMKDLETRLGPEKFKDLEARMFKYFEAPKRVLDELKADGIINAKLYNELKNTMYQPRKFINRLEGARKENIGGRTITVTNSGIKELNRGSAKAIETNSRLLLSEYLIRMENIKARNKANKALHRFAELVPDNGFIKLPKNVEHTAKGGAKNVHTPEGYTRVDVMIDGKQQPMLMEKSMAEQWILSDPQLKADFANAVRIGSGGAILRPLATGVNPGFALVNFTRDLNHIYLASGVYSKHLPITTVQMGIDFASVIKDAWRKEGRFVDYINEGGGMNFLTHQGVEIIRKSDAGVPGMSRGWRHTKEALSKINETSEIVTRLMIRERALKQGKTPEMATWEARNYLDFAQGGTWAKAIDNGIPYFNASIQAFRTGARRAKQHPVEAAVKYSWLIGTTSGLMFSNYARNPEGMKHVPQKVLRENWVIMLPESMKIIDRNGNVRYPYIPIKKDNILMLATAPIEALIRKYAEGRNPDQSTLDVIKSAAPITPGGMISPIPSAYLTYMSNHEFWNDEKVWKGPEFPGAEEFEFKVPPDQPTPMMYRDIGMWTGMSPERLRAAKQKIIPNNTYTDIIGRGWNHMYEGMDPVTQSQTNMEMLANAPILRRVLKLTHPASVEVERAEEKVGQIEGQRFQKLKGLDHLYFLNKQGELEGGEKTIRAYINAQPFEDRERFMNRFQTMKFFDEKIQPRMRDKPGIPDRTWWLWANNVSPEARANIFFMDYYKGADKQTQRDLMGIARRIPGFQSDSFMREFISLRKEWGDEGADSP